MPRPHIFAMDALPTLEKQCGPQIVSSWTTPGVPEQPHRSLSEEEAEIEIDELEHARGWLAPSHPRLARLG